MQSVLCRPDDVTTTPVLSTGLLRSTYCTDRVIRTCIFADVATIQVVHIIRILSILVQSLLCAIFLVLFNLHRKYFVASS
jgi:hypothetical protein